METRRHFAIGPIPINTTSGNISGTNTAEKYGGPTDSLGNPKASRNRGYKVPISIVSIATTNSTLLISNIVSFETTSKRPPDENCVARHAYKDNDPPTTTAKKASI